MSRRARTTRAAARARRCRAVDQLVLSLQLAHAMRMTIVLSNNQPTVARWEDAIVVATPLDAIVRLEHDDHIGTVVLAGTFAGNSELASFFDQFYPNVRIEREA